MDKEVTDYGHTDSGAPYVPQRNQTAGEEWEGRESCGSPFVGTVKYYRDRTTIIL